MKRLSLSIAVAVAAVTAAPVALAQSVMLPADNAPAATSAPADVSGAPDAAPPTVAAMPSVAPNVPGGAPASSSQTILPGLSPDQVAQARKSFEALAATNPAAAQNNPFAQLDALTAAQGLQDDISRQVRDACKLDFFNVQLPMDGMRDPAVLLNVKAYAGPAIVAAVRSVCSDEESTETLKNSIGVFNVQHQAGQATPKIDGGLMQATLIYDFTSGKGPDVGALVSQMRAALAATVEKNTRHMQAAGRMNQDDVQRQMRENIGRR